MEKENVTGNLDSNVLQVEGRIEFSNHEDTDAVYTEYNIGHFAGSFSLGSAVDPDTIEASVKDGVPTLTLHKKKEVQPRRIQDD